jgi:TatD DNase family protein
LVKNCANYAKLSRNSIIWIGLLNEDKFGLSKRQNFGKGGMTMNWIDCHNHLQFGCLGEAEPMLAAMACAGVECCVVNATRESDWEAVAALAQAYPEKLIPAFGIHPWHAHEAGGQWQARLRGLLDSFPQASVGECGLDRWVAVPGPELQWPVFLAQLRIAREMRRAVSIHCVRAWGLLLDALAAEAPPPRFLLHSFGGSLEIARRLLPLGAYFSCSGRILQPRQATMLEEIRQLPRARILLETDAPEMLPPPEYVTHPLPENRNHPANLAAIGGGLAVALGMSAGELAALTTNNARACFGL